MALGGNAAAWAATTLQKIRKNIKSAIEQDATLMNSIQKLPKEMVASDQSVRVPLKITFPGKYGAIDLNGGVFGDGGGAETTQGTLTTVARRHALALNLQPIFNTNSGEKAIANALVKQTADGLPEFLAMLERECQTTGNGQVATVTSVSSNDVTCTASDFGIQLVRKGNTYQIFTAAYAADRGSSYVTKVVPSTNTFTFASIPGSTAATDCVVIEGIVRTAPVGILGIQAGMNGAATGTYLGIDRATVPEARTPFVDAGGAFMSLYHLRLAMNRMRTKRGIDTMKSAKVKVHIHPAQTAQYEDLTVTYTELERSGTSSTANLLPFGKGSISAIEGLPAMESINAPKNRIDVLELDDWFCAETVPIDFFDFPDTGKPVRIQVDGTTGTPKARLLWYLFAQLNIANANPGNGCSLTNLGVTTGY